MSVKIVLCHGRRRQLKRLSVYKNAALIWGTCQPAGHFYVVGKSCPLSLSSLEKQDLRTTVKNTLQNKARFMLYFGVHISLPATGLERSMCMGAACSLSKPEAVIREMIMAQFIPISDRTRSMKDDKRLTGPQKFRNCISWWNLREMPLTEPHQPEQSYRLALNAESWSSQVP